MNEEIENILPENDLPSDVEPEKAVLGAITLNNGLITQALSYLEKADFLFNSHKRIFDAMVSLKERGIPIDTLTLPTLLKERKELERVGGVVYLASLIDGVPQTDNIEHYCRIIKYKAREREAITVLNHSINEVVDGEDKLEIILERIQSRLAKISTSGSKNGAIAGVYDTLDKLFDAQIVEPEEVLFGLHRGEVGGLFAVTNYGKSTLLYNIALSIAAGQTFWPLARLVPKTRRVLYIDSESPTSRSRADFKTMIRSLSDSNSACKNLSVVLDASIDDSPLNLSKTAHFKWLVDQAKEYRADLVIIDTAASAFELQDENNNAEITRRLMNPLKQLAREANCAVIFSHHIGKASETQPGEDAYKGRGASALGGLSRAVFTLMKDTTKGPGYVILKCAKVKGQPFEPVLMRLEERWFSIVDEKPVSKDKSLTAQEVADYVHERYELTQSNVQTADIEKRFIGPVNRSTVSNRIKDAESLELIERVSKGYYKPGSGYQTPAQRGLTTVVEGGI